MQERIPSIPSQPLTSFKDYSWLVEEALNDKELQEGLQQAGITEEEAHEFIERRWEGIVEEVGFDEKEMRILDKDISFKEMIQSSIEAKNKQKAIKQQMIARILFYLSLSYIIFNIAGIVIVLIDDSSINKQFIAELIGFKDTNSNAFNLFYYFILFVPVTFFSFDISRRANRYLFEKTNELNKYKEIAQPASYEIKQITLQRNKFWIDHFVHTLNNIRETLRERINEQFNLQYSLKLQLIEAPGLAETSSLKKMVSTSTIDDLDFLLNNMSGGSIGISGPRGVGKSTLISYFCEGKGSGKLKSGNILPVNTSAPIEYNVREFILHLFASICKNILQLENQTFNYKELLQDEEKRKPSNKDYIFYFIGRLLKKTAMLSFILIMIGLSLLLLILSGTKTGLDFVTIFKESKISAFPFLSWGIIIYLFNLFLLRTQVVKDFIESTASKIEDHKKTQEEIEIKNPPSPLAMQAKKWLRQIKFQQSFTLAQTGAFKLPGGLEEGLNTAYSLSENQLTTPEIIGGFRELLHQISQKYTILIGIDEMDKMDSDEQAKRFLNEIKSVFGIPGCFFLISVSEDAIRAFEKNGHSFRDVFDSSFDHIVNVEYLSLDAAKALLKRRVIGNYGAFFGLSYCLSGGLARDLIRNFREIVKLSVREKENLILADVCRYLLALELKGKIRAFTYSAQKLSNRGFANLYCSIVYELDGAAYSNKIIAQSIRELNEIESSLDGDKKNAFETKQEQQTAFSLCQDLSTYLYYIDTVLQTFNNQLNETEYSWLENSGFLEDLVKVAQLMSRDTYYAKKLLGQLREKQKMQPIF